MIIVFADVVYVPLFFKELVFRVVPGVLENRSVVPPGVEKYDEKYIFSETRDKNKVSQKL